MFKIFLEIAMNLYAICLLEIYIGFRILKTVFESSFAHGIFQKQSALIPFLEFLFYFKVDFELVCDNLFIWNSILMCLAITSILFSDFNILKIFKMSLMKPFFTQAPEMLSRPNFEVDIVKSSGKTLSFTCSYLHPDEQGFIPLKKLSLDRGLDLIP